MCWKAAAFEQTWRFQPGWQAVYLEVDPSDRRPEAVFGGLSIEGVWTWSERESRLEELQDLGEPLQDRAHWRVWYPSSRPESRLNTLASIEPGRAYLLKVAGGRHTEVLNTRVADGSTVAMTNIFWRVSGRPVLPVGTWPAHAFCLRGVPVDDGGSTTVAAFFGASPSHFNASLGKPHGLWTLETEGRWRPMLPEDPLIRGRAYWIRTEDPSDFVAPLRLDAGSGDFGSAAGSLRLSLHAIDGLARVVSVVRLDAAAGPLQLARTLAGRRQVGPAPVVSGVALRPSGTAVYELVADRSLQDSALYETVYLIRDNRGSQYHLPVRVER